MSWNKTENSILVSWAINNVSASLSTKEKNLNWEDRVKLYKERYQEFINIHHDYMMDHMPTPTTPTKRLNWKEKDKGKEAQIDIARQQAEEKKKEEESDALRSFNETFGE